MLLVTLLLPMQVTVFRQPLDPFHWYTEEKYSKIYYLFAGYEVHILHTEINFVPQK